MGKQIWFLSFVVSFLIFPSASLAAPPVLGVSPTYMEFTAYAGEANPDPNILSIWRDGGNGPLNWTVTEDCNWLTVDPNSSKSMGEVDDCNVIVDISGLVEGSYSCELTVDAGTAANSPQIVTVTLRVYPYGLYVPREYGTIQAAINAAVDGDTIIIEPGTYTGSGNRNLNFGGKAITVQSVDPNDPNIVSSTVINCQGSSSNPRRGFYFRTGEGPNSVVAGLTITNGVAPNWSYAGFTISLGGAIFCNGASPTIANCIITGNASGNDSCDMNFGGGGIYCKWSSPRIVNCTITNNSAGSGWGGGIGCAQSSPTIRNCIIMDNWAESGGGISLIGGSNPTLINNCIICDNSSNWTGGIDLECQITEIRNCTISGNSGRGVYCPSCCQTSLISCIVWGNDGPEVGGEGTATISYSDVEGGYTGTGNIDADPCFVNASNGDYHLLSGSPCIDAGDPCYLPSPEENDIDGKRRLTGWYVEMGADELAYEAPFIWVSSTELEFWPNAKTQFLSIRNTGVDTLNWVISEDCNWLSVEPNSGGTTREIDDVNVSVDINGLTAGTYNTSLTITDTNALNSPLIIDVNLVIHDVFIELSVQEFIFQQCPQPTPYEQVLTVRNNGIGTLNWTTSHDCNWLDVEPNSGVSTGEPNEVTLTVDRTGLTKGIHDCNLTISDPCADNNPQIVTVSLNVDFPSDEPDEWAAVGYPDCWCYPRQCHGDADNMYDGDPKSGYFSVWGSDLGMLIEGWQQPYSGDPNLDGPDPGSEPDIWICADFTHYAAGDPKSGYFRVLGDDLGVLIANWQSNPPPDCP